jgi:hypothetical protein
MMESFAARQHAINDAAANPQPTGGTTAPSPIPAAEPPSVTYDDVNVNTDINSD